MKRDNLILYGLIDGQSKPASLKGYIDCLVSELSVLEGGLTTFDAASGTSFQLRAKLLISVQDYQGYRDVACQRVSGKHRTLRVELINSTCKECTLAHATPTVHDAKAQSSN
jgi:hypothetical protein